MKNMTKVMILSGLVMGVVALQEPLFSMSSTDSAPASSQDKKLAVSKIFSMIKSKGGSVATNDTKTLMDSMQGLTKKQLTTAVTNIGIADSHLSKPMSLSLPVGILKNKGAPAANVYTSDISH